MCKVNISKHTWLSWSIWFIRNAFAAGSVLPTGSPSCIEYSLPEVKRRSDQLNVPTYVHCMCECVCMCVCVCVCVCVCTCVDIQGTHLLGAR